MRPIFVAAHFIFQISFGALSAPAALGSDELIDLGTLNRGRSFANGVSGDGSIVVGVTGGGSAANPFGAFRWSQPSGMASLGNLNGGSWSIAWGLSADGSVVIGSAADGAVANVMRAFRWTQAEGMVSLGTLNGGASSEGRAVSGDGTVIVGRTQDGAAANEDRAFRWTQASGMASLGTLNGGNWSNALGVSANGLVVVGSAGDGAAGNQARAFRWTQASGMASLGTLNGGFHSEARGASADGAVIVGLAFDGAAANAMRAFRWTQASGMVNLGTLNGGSLSAAFGISADGSVIVGSAADGAAANADTAFRWTQASGMLSVKNWLRLNGVRVAPELTLNTANAANGDGSVVVGEMCSTAGCRAYLARVSSFGSGLITPEEFSASLSSPVPQQVAISNASLVMHGAHGNPLLGRVSIGQSCVWATGDWGRDDHDSRDGSLGVAEFGACHRLASGVQLSAAFGGTRARQNLMFDGNIRQTGSFALVEGMAQTFRTDLWVTVTGYYGWGEAEVRRGYLNAATPDTSEGTVNTPTWGVRARLDWENALRAGDAGFTPYGELSYIKAKVEAYTENGGGFPAHFDARTESATELRVGINAIKPLPNDVRLLGTLEGVHQFSDQGSRSTGQVLGLFPFDVPGAQYKRNWLRINLGTDAKLGGGTASLMLNATTAGQDSSYWLSAHYRYAF